MTELSSELARYEAELALERRLAAAQGRAYAEPIKWTPPWCVGGGAFPRVVSNSQFVVLVYEVETHDGDDGDAGRADPPTAVVTFVGWPNAMRLGSPNSETLVAHPLARTLSDGRAHVVKNSPWLAELRQLNSMHESFDSAFWDTCNHYLLPFHDAMFECIAGGITTEVRSDPIDTVLPIPVPKSVGANLSGAWAADRP
ncbi:MAG: hypothetical protein JWM47_2851 [Acidimicrobiales bacterium]|nr:hypothetical protein [Acidimicrobiales bacterium]